MILAEFSRELEISKRSNVDFVAVREPLDVSDDAALAKLVVQLPLQFNACYLVMIAWLSRMYELQQWKADTPRRLAIEMIATWPLMSLAIRPALELASFFRIDKQQLFRLEEASLPEIPVSPHFEPSVTHFLNRWVDCFPEKAFDIRKIFSLCCYGPVARGAFPWPPFLLAI
ncbi:MAG: hypothetical protein WA673_19575 [Candidatus Acidiferrales bacterium]